MSDCVFQPPYVRGSACQRCGRLLRSTFDSHPKANCKGNSPGDALEDLLTSYGITKEWWQQYKTTHGLPPTCGCDSRRKYLNDLAQSHPNLAKFGVMVFRALTRKRK